MQLSSKSTTYSTLQNAEFDSYRKKLQARVVKLRGEPIFDTNMVDLWEEYLGQFSTSADRQYSNCNCCKSFMRQYGNLVTVNAEGVVSSVMWDEREAPVAYVEAIKALRLKVVKAKITGVFKSAQAVLGNPKTGTWTHFATMSPDVSKHPTLEAHQVAAEKLQDYKTLRYALSATPITDLEKVVEMLGSDSMYRSEKVLGQAQFLLELANTKNVNLFWRKVALAPAGFCHPRSSMIGTILEDLAERMPFDDIKRRFAAKMSPLAYQRPTVAPNSGAIAAAEALFEKLGAASALERRFATMDDVTCRLWEPSTLQKAGGVFGRLQPTPAKTLTDSSLTSITWVKFRDTVIGNAESIEVLCPHRSSYITLTTAVDEEAVPIFQWDSLEQRNPVAWYVHGNGSFATSHKLTEGFNKVKCITLLPSLWNGGNEHQGKRAIFLIEGAASSEVAGLAIFPETLKSEFHGVRSVIEKFSNTGKLQGVSSAVGLAVDEKSGVTVQVTTKHSITRYQIERWD